MGQSTKENGAKASIVVMCIVHKFDSLDQEKPMEWAYTRLPAAKVLMKESGGTGKHKVLVNLLVPLEKRCDITLVSRH